MLSKVIKALLEQAPVPVSCFFLGIVIGGIPALLKKAKSGDQISRFSSVVFFLIGLGIVISIGYIPTGTMSVTSGSGFMHYVMLFVTGLIIAVALVLPGISTSHMLLVLGMYDAMLTAVNHVDLVYIGVLGVVTVIGVFLITRPLDWMMKKFSRQTYCVVLGFVLGSTWDIVRDKVLPAIPVNVRYSWWIQSILISIIAFTVGIVGMISLSKFSNE